MKFSKALSLAVLGLTLSYCLDACGNTAAKLTQFSAPLVANAPVNRDGSVSIEVSHDIGADIRVSAWDHNRAQVTLSDDTATQLELVKGANDRSATFRVVVSSNSRPSFLDRIFRRPQAVIEVRVPRQIRLSIATSNGPTEVKSVVGPISVTCENGPITIDGAGSLISVEAKNGSIFASVVDTGRQPNIRLKLIDGPVELEVPPNFRASIQTHHIFGPADVAASIQTGPGTVSLSTVAGPIDVRVAAKGRESP
jgi:hypothetical protein